MNQIGRKENGLNQMTRWMSQDIGEMGFECVGPLLRGQLSWWLNLMDPMPKRLSPNNQTIKEQWPAEEAEEEQPRIR